MVGNRGGRLVFSALIALLFVVVPAAAGAAAMEVLSNFSTADFKALDKAR